MKKTTKVTIFSVPKNLKQVSYENQHGLVLCKDRQACPHCGKVIVTHFILCPEFDLRLYITKEHYDYLLENEFEHSPVETMMELFEEGGKILSIGGLSFWKDFFVGSTTPESTITISKSCGKELIELVFAGERFRDLQDILNYKLANFYADLNSGNYRVGIRA